MDVEPPRPIVGRGISYRPREQPQFGDKECYMWNLHLTAAVVQMTTCQ